MEEAGGRQDCVQECVRFSAVRGHGDVRERIGAMGTMSGLPGGLVKIQVLLVKVTEGSGSAAWH